MPEQPPDNPPSGAAPSGPPDQPDQPTPPSPPPPAEPPAASSPPTDPPPSSPPTPPPPAGAGASASAGAGSPGGPGVPGTPGAAGAPGAGGTGPASGGRRFPVVPVAIAAVVLIVVVVAAVFVLGGDDGPSQEEQEYADALAVNLNESGDDTEQFNEEQADCVAGAMVDVIGLDRLQDAGTPEELREDPDLLDLDLEQGEANSFYDDFEGCVDVQEFFLAQFEGLGMPDEVVSCVADNLSDDLLRASLVAEFTGDDEASEAADAALEEAIGPCEDLAE